MLIKRYKLRAKLLQNISKPKPSSIAMSLFHSTLKMKSYLCEGLNGSFQEESFYRIDFVVVRVFDKSILIKFKSKKSGKNVEKHLFLPYDHPCLFYNMH